jgi:cytochrome c peroxidase
LKEIVAILIVGFIVVSASIVSAGKNKIPTTHSQPEDTIIHFHIPPGFPKPATDIFAHNPLTEAGFQLGRKLFYDGNLSKDGNFSCASCHQQYAAFCTSDHDFSHGVNNTFTTRNAPALFNIAWIKRLHWDGGVNNIEVQPLAPITSINEMAESIDSILIKLKKDTSYARMFKQAFGSSLINSQRMLKALAQFVGSLVSYNSKYDKVKRGEDTFEIFEQHGYDIFRSKCASCHTEPLFTDNSFHNNGLPLNNYLCDVGRMRITNDSKDSLKFKVPSLRNIARTQPYMHDGRFYTLDQVLEHYRTGIENGPTLDTLLKNGISMTDLEKRDLKYFLWTLTDTSFLKDPRFSAPR